MEKESPSQPQPKSGPNPPAPKTITTWPGAFGLYKPSAKAVQLNLNTYLLLVAAQIVLGIVLGIIFPHQIVPREIIAWLVGLYIGIAQIYANVAGAQNQALEFDRSLSLSAPVYLQMLLVHILTALVVLVGLVLLIVPGVIFAVRLSLAPYFLADQKLDAMDAMKASWAATRGNSGKIWGIVGVYVLMVLPVFTIIGILATIYLLFMYQAALGLLYVYLKSHPSQQPQNG